MNPYIIRVCRNSPQDDRACRFQGVLELHGVLEKARTEEDLVFQSFEEIWPILSSEETLHYNFASIEQKKSYREKRSHFRFDCRCPITYHVKGGSSDSDKIGNGPGKLVDVSRSGMRIETTRRIAITKEFQVFIPMEKLPVTFLFPVQVKWNERNPFGNYLMGLHVLTSLTKNSR